MAFRLSGAALVRRARDRRFARRFTVRRRRVEDEAAVTIDFPSGEAAIALTWNGSVRRNAMRLQGSRGEIVLADDTLRVLGDARASTTFASALSAGSHHADWFAAMLPDVVRCFREPALSRPLFEEAADCLSIIAEAYRCDRSFAALRPLG